MAEQMNFSQYLEMLELGVLIPLCKVEFLRQEDESVQSSIIKQPLTSSSLTVDASSASVRRSVSLVLDNSNKEFLPSIDTLWIGTKFQLYLGYKDNQDREIFFEAGLFCLFDSEPEIISAFSSQTVNISAQDKWCLLNVPIGHVYIIPSGTLITEAVASILTLVGDKKVPIMKNLKETAPFDLRFAESSTYGEMLRSMANLYSREAFYNPTGHFVLQEFITEDTSETIYSLDTSHVGYMGSTITMKYSEVFNHIFVTGASQASNIAYIGESRNDDLTSNTRIALIGDKPMPIITDAKLTTNNLCQQRADYELLKAKRMQQTISISCIALFHAEVNKAITITDEAINLYRKRFIIQQYSIPLDAKSAMTITGFLFNDGVDFDDRLSVSTTST